MPNSARKFIQRSPRYIIQPNDDRYVRFARKEDTEQSYTTRLLNISTTGLAFVADRDCSPNIGDLIKVEFPIGSERFAWWGRVVRLQEYQQSVWSTANDPSLISDDIFIGVHFHDLPIGHSEEIKKHLEHKFIELVKSQNKEKLLTLVEFLARHIWAVLIYGVCAILTFGILLWLASPINPADRYDPNRGTHWGKRFDF